MYYLDANATSRLRPQVIEAIKDLCSGGPLFANPSSVHAAGRNARAQVGKARKSILQALLGEAAGNARLVFTSGGTEACNSLIHGFLDTIGNAQKGHIVASAIEHQAILEPLKLLGQRGFQISYVLPEQDSIIDAEKFLAAVSSQTQLVVLMAANNVTGAIQPVAEITRSLRASGFAGAIVADATQLVSKSTLEISSLLEAGVDAVAISGHKIGGPAGIGAILLNTGSDTCRSFYPLLLGGPHEDRFRAGSENLIGIIGFAAAARALNKSEVLRMTNLREELSNKILTQVPETFRLSPQDTDASKCLSNTLALRFAGVRGDDLVVALDLRGVCCSTGSACASGRQDASYVFTAMGLAEKQAKEAIRLSLDWDISADKIDRVAEIISQTVKQMREIEAREVA